MNSEDAAVKFGTSQVTYESIIVVSSVKAPGAQ